MKKNVIAVLLSVVLGAGGIGTATVMAAETAGQEAALAQNETEAEVDGVDNEIAVASDAVSVDEDVIILNEDLPEEVEYPEPDAGLDADYVSREEDDLGEHGFNQEAGQVSDQESKEVDEEREIVAEREDEESADVGAEDSATDDGEAAGMEFSAEVENSSEEKVDEQSVTEEDAEVIEPGKIALAEDLVDSGSCGDNATWTLTGTENDLTLTISGSGDMNDFMYLKSPWISKIDNIKTVIVEDGITTIGNNSFNNCAGITSIIIPDKVNRIGDHAFRNCNSLASIIIPDKVNQIGGYAFYGCSSLTNIIIPDGVTQIGEAAFYGCSSLTSITIPEGVSQICKYMFWKCSSLTSITIPNGVTQIGSNAFSDCSSLTSITIPEGVNQIDNYMFSGCSNLTSITIPDGVTQIGAGAFSGCSNLTSIMIPGGVTRIKDDAFAYCSSLTNITIPDGVTEIGSYAFAYCSSLTNITIPDGVTRIDGHAFADCSNLTNITIPNRVNEIGEAAFINCSRLEKIIILENVTAIVEEAFANCDQLVDVYTIKGCVADQYFTEAGFSPHYIHDPAGSTSFYSRYKKLVLENGDIVNVSDFLIITENTDVNSIEFSGYNKNILFFDSGKLAAMSEGNTIITVTCGDEKLEIPVSVVNKAVPATTIAFDSENLTMPCGGKASLVLNVTPENATPGTVKWATSDSTVVSVDDGLLHAKTEGKATITATMTAGADTLTVACEVTVTDAVSAIVAFDEVEIERGKSEKLYYNLYPSTSEAIMPYTFESDDPDIAEVSEDGVVTGKAFGSANVTITNGDLTKTVKVRVVAKLKSISLNKNQVRIPVNWTSQLKVIYDPEDTTDDRNISWYSSNTNIARVDKNGVVTARAKGIVTITAMVGEYLAECNVLCIDSSTPISLTGIELPEDETMEYGTTFIPEVTYIPEDATDNRTVTWTSSNTKIFKVSMEGVVTPIGIGTATLTAKVGNYTATMKITVVKATPDYEKPKKVDAHCGQKLSDFTLPAGFAWDNPNQDVGSAGTNSFTVTYTPVDPVHYSTVEGISVLVKVEHAFADKWTVGSDQHWHECVCGEIRDEAAHEYGNWKVARKASCEKAGQKERPCTVCGHKETEDIPATGHVWEEEYKIDVEPTYVKDGSESIHCSVCGQSEPGTERVIPKKDDPFSVDATFTVEKPAFNYTGNPIEPGVIVTYKGDQFEEGRDYSVAYSNNIDLGMANVDVYGMGEYSGVKHLQFKIRIGATKKVTCTNVASGMKVSWEKVNGATRYKVYRDGKLIFTTSALVVTDKEVKYNAGTKYVYKVVAYAKGFGDSDVFRTGTYYRLMPVGIKSLSNPSAGKMTVTYDKSSGSTGYVVRYGLKPEMTDAKVITVAGDNTLSRTFAGMKKGMTYYVQVRTYKLDNGVRYYSGYCTTKTIKITK